MHFKEQSNNHYQKKNNHYQERIDLVDAALSKFSIFTLKIVKNFDETSVVHKKLPVAEKWT